jgi:hypothetical protein
MELPMTMKFGESFEKFALELFKGDNLVAMKFRFYLIWIYLYLVVCKSVIISNSYLSLVILFFKHDKPLAHAPMFLEIIFNNFHDVIDENLSGLLAALCDLLYFRLQFISLLVISEFLTLIYAKSFSYSHFYSLVMSFLITYFSTIMYEMISIERTSYD